MTSNNPLKPVIAAPLTMGETYSPSKSRKHRRSERTWRTEGAPFNPALVTRNPGRPVSATR